MIARAWLVGLLTVITFGGTGCLFVPEGAGDDPGDPTDQPDAGATGPSDGAPVNVVCLVEGLRLGVTGLRVQSGAIVIEFESWIARDGKPDELIGFTLSPSASGVRYQVVTDRHEYLTEGLTWTIPEGRGSPQIVSIDFCVDDP